MRREFIPKVILLTGDIICLTVAWFLAYEVRDALTPLFGYRINPLRNYLEVYPVFILLWVFSAFSYGLYRRLKDVTPTDEFKTFFKTVFLGSTITMSLAFLLREYELGRSVILLFNLFSFLFLGTFRIIYHRIEKEMRKKGIGVRRVLIVGAGVTGLRVLQKIEDHPEIGFIVEGFIDADEKKWGSEIGGVKVLGGPDKLIELVRERKIDEVIIALPSLPKDEVMNWICELEPLNVRVRVVSDAFSVLAKEGKVDVVGEFPLLELGSGEVSPFYPYIKRLIDLTLSILLLIITFPLWIIISIAIKLDSKGPVFFKHERVGYKGKRFILYKFRTMYVDTPPYKEAPKDERDPRITRVGRFLRRTSLDELPQLINVIKGDMSLVGPRPEMPFIVEKYSSWERRRLDVKPGITGMWQILGRKDLPLQENIHYDLYYVKNRSLLLDLLIILKTIPAVFKKKGAY